MPELQQALAEILSPGGSLSCFPRDEASVCFIRGGSPPGRKGLRDYGGKVFGGSFVWIARAKDLAGDWKDTFDEGLVDGLRLNGLRDVDVLGGFGRDLLFGCWG